MANVPLRPINTSFYGAFQTPGGPDNGSGQGPDVSWQYENWDFEAHFKPQIDAMVASLQGDTFIYFSANPSSTVTIPQLVSYHRQILSYCYSCGLYVFIYFSGNSSQWGGTSYAAAAVIFAAVAAAAAQFTNFIGGVLIDEDYTVGGATGATLTGNTLCYNTVKAVIPPNIPIGATSNPGGVNASPVFSNNSTLAAVASINDIFVYNPQAAYTLSDVAAIQSSYPGKQIVMAGAVASTDDGTSATITTALMAMVDPVNIPLFGYFIMQDFPIPAPTHAFGMFDVAMAPKATRTAAFSAGRRGQATPVAAVRNSYGNPALNQLRQWG